MRRPRRLRGRVTPTPHGLRGRARSTLADRACRRRQRRPPSRHDARLSPARSRPSWCPCPWRTTSTTSPSTWGSVTPMNARIVSVEHENGSALRRSALRWAVGPPVADILRGRFRSGSLGDEQPVRASLRAIATQGSHSSRRDHRAPCGRTRDPAHRPRPGSAVGRKGTVTLVGDAETELWCDRPPAALPTAGCNLHPSAVR